GFFSAIRGLKQFAIYFAKTEPFLIAILAYQISEFAK
ncbi:MAG: hypothetical protein ACI97N_001582, partial [Cognaticolwellia sp.]